MKVLVVDDEKDMQALFLQRFRREIRDNKVGFAFALSAEQALNYLNAHTHEAVLILSDINMPGMSGLELLRQIREVYVVPPPEVMMITAYSDEQSYRQAMQYGANDFLTKPLDFDDLKRKLSINL